MHIPYEKGGGKLADQGQKRYLIGMEGRGIYHILIPKTGQIIRSRNVVFKEGLGHCMLTDEGEYFADDGDMDYDFLGEEIPTEGSPITAAPSKTILDPANTLDMPTLPINKPKISHPHITYPPVSRKSSHLAAATETAIPLITPTKPEVIDDQTVPIIEPEDEDDEAPTALTANFPPDPLNKFVPHTFEEAFDLTHCHLWMPPMEKEIERWDARGVITAVPRPKGIKTIKGKWVYDLKVDGAGNLVRRRAHGGLHRSSGSIGGNHLMLS